MTPLHDAADSDSDGGAGSITIQENHHEFETLPNPRDPDDQGKSPNTLDRSCTDVCMLPFLLSLAAVSVLATIDNFDSALFMNQHEWSAVQDFAGIGCGFGSNLRKPYLFLCLLDASLVSPTSDNSSVGSRLDKEHPICVEQCPKTRNDSQDCVDGYDTITNSPTWLRKPSYTSDAVLGIFCQPASPVFHNDYRNIFADFVGFIEISYPADFGAYLVFLFTRANEFLIDSVQRDLTLLATTGLMAAIFSYAYAHFLATFANSIVWLSVTFLVSSLFLSGGWIYYTAASGSNQSRFGGFLIMLSLIVVCWTRQLEHEINGATRCLMKAGTCIADSAILKLVPLLSIFLKSAAALHPLLVLAIILRGHLLNTKEHAEGCGSLGMWYMYLLIPASLIGYNTFHAIFMYITSHAAGAWYFREEATRSPYWVVLRYHLGSIALGGLVQMLLWPCKLLFGIPLMFFRQMGFFQDLVSAYDENISKHNSAVWCDMSMQGFSYCKTARHVMFVRTATADTGRMVVGATVAFQVLGAVVVSYSSLWCSVVIEVVTGIDEHDTTQMLATIVAFWVSMNIMLMLGEVSDSLIYYKRVDHLRKGEDENMHQDICSHMHVLSMFH